MLLGAVLAYWPLLLYSSGYIAAIALAHSELRLPAAV